MNVERGKLETAHKNQRTQHEVAMLLVLLPARLEWLKGWLSPDERSEILNMYKSQQIKTQVLSRTMRSCL